jgi:hypothetical protein
MCAHYIIELGNVPEFGNPQPVFFGSTTFDYSSFWIPQTIPSFWIPQTIPSFWIPQTFHYKEFVKKDVKTIPELEKIPTMFKKFIGSMKYYIPEIYKTLIEFKNKHPSCEKMCPEDVDEVIKGMIENHSVNPASASLDSFIQIWDLNNLYSYYLGIIDFYIDLYKEFTFYDGLSKVYESFTPVDDDKIPDIVNSRWYAYNIKEKPKIKFLKIEKLINLIREEIKNIGNLKDLISSGRDYRYEWNEKPSFDLDLASYIEDDGDSEHSLGETSVKMEDGVNVVTIEKFGNFDYDLYSGGPDGILTLLIKHPELISRVNDKWIFKDGDDEVVKIVENMLMYCCIQSSIEACMILVMCGADPTIEVKPEDEYWNCPTPQEFFAYYRKDYLTTITIYEMTKRSYDILEKDELNTMDRLRNDYKTFKNAKDQDVQPLTLGYRPQIVQHMCRSLNRK